MFVPKRAFAVALSLAGLTPATAVAQDVTPQHARQYAKAYYAVQHQFGHRAPGRQIVKWGFDSHHKATDAEVVTSLAVLGRMLAPPPAPAPAQAVQTSQNISQPSSAPQTSSNAGAGSGLAACIIQRESGGNPQATSGQYTGIAQWSPSAWAQDGGTQYAPTPTGASAAQQMAVLNSALAAGQSGQWTPYDQC